MLILLVFTIIPVISAVGISLFNMNMFFKDTAFVGLAITKRPLPIRGYGTPLATR